MHKKIGLTLGPWAAAATLLMPVSSVFAQSNPLSLVLSERLSTDNNFLRRQDGGPSETTSVTSATVAVNKAYGRQNYGASLSATAERHNRFKEYNNDGYSLVLGMNSTVGRKGYVSLQHARSSSLQSPDEQTGLRYNDTVKANSTSLFTQYGIAGRFAVNASLSNSKTDYSVNTGNNRDSTGLRLGVSYSPSDLLSFGLGAKKTDQKLANAGEKINRYDYDINTSWVVTGYSRLNAAIALTDEKRTANSGLDFRGFTGQLGWGFTPGGKLSYSLTISRDTTSSGQGASTTLVVDKDNSVLGSIRNQTQNQLTTAINARVNWAATSKIGASLGLNFRRFDDSREAEIIGSISGLESQFLPSRGKQYGLNFSVTYNPVRSTRLGCSIESYKRTQARLGVSGYRGETLACDANFTIE